MFKLCRTLVVTGMTIALGACGAAAGKKNAQNVVSGAKSASSEFVIPSINFLLPGSASSLSFGLDDADPAAFLAASPTPDSSPVPKADILTDTRERVNDRITKLNADMVKWKGEFSEVGEFTGKGPNKDKSGSLAAIDDGTYNHKLVVCEKGSLHMVVKWSEDGKNIYSFRNQRYKPQPETSSILMVYSETDAGKTFTQKFFGEKDKSPAGEAGSNLADLFVARESAAGEFTFSGVEDWFSGDLAARVEDADGYILGQLSSDGNSGEFVSYRKGATGCAATFAEDAPEFCKSRAIGGVTDYDATATAEAYARLQALGVGVTPKASLGDPTESEACPAVVTQAP